MSKLLSKLTLNLPDHQVIVTANFASQKSHHVCTFLVACFCGEFHVSLSGGLSSTRLCLLWLFLCSLTCPKGSLNHLVLREGALSYLASECFLLINSHLQDTLKSCTWHYKYTYKWISVLNTNILQVPS